MEHSSFEIALQTDWAGWFALTCYVPFSHYLNDLSKINGNCRPFQKFLKRSASYCFFPVNIGRPVPDLNHCVVGILPIASFASVWMAV